MEGMSAILDREFYNNVCDFTNIKKIVLPSTIESIGDYAFARLESLETIVCKAKTPPQINLSFLDIGTKKVFSTGDKIQLTPVRDGVLLSSLTSGDVATFDEIKSFWEEDHIVN